MDVLNVCFSLSQGPKLGSLQSHRRYCRRDNYKNSLHKNLQLVALRGMNACDLMNVAQLEQCVQPTKA